MSKAKIELFIAALAAAIPVFGGLTLQMPEEGAVVPLLSDGQKAWLDRTREERRVSFADEEERKAMRKLGYIPQKVVLEWKWAPEENENSNLKGARPLYTVEVRKLPSGVPVYRADCPTPHAEVDNLEIAREYEWTVWANVLGRIEESATGRFATEDHAPRLINLGAVPNVRDIGGRKGLDGRRVRQGLIFRSAGLNENASDDYTTRDEALAMADDKEALLDREAALKERADQLRVFQANPGNLKLLSAGLTPEWSVFRVAMGDADFIAKGIPVVCGLDSIPDTLLGAAKETATLDANGIFDFTKEARDTARGPAVFVKEIEFQEDGFITLGCGADWWWNFIANGEVVFDRSFQRGNNRSPVDSTNHSLLVPVRKGKNIFAACVKGGSAGWRFACKAAPSQPIATVLASTIRNFDEQATMIFKIYKGQKPGKTRISEENRNVALKQLGIKSDIDLRTDKECFGMEGSPLGPSVTWWHYSSAGYGGMKEKRGRDAFADVFRVFLDPANYPIDFHCIAGQDRTGAVAFILNGLLGVEEEELYRDWESTGFWNPSAKFNHARLFDFLVAVFDEYPGETINERIAGYVKSLGFTDDDIAKFRAIMLE